MNNRKDKSEFEKLHKFLSFFRKSFCLGLRQFKRKLFLFLLFKSTSFFIAYYLFQLFKSSDFYLAYEIEHLSSFFIILIHGLLFSLFLVLQGLPNFLDLENCKKNLKSANILNSMKMPPLVISAKSKNELYTLRLDIKGLDIDLFKKKKKSLESSFELYLQEIKETKNPRYIDLVFCAEKLPRLIKFSEILNKIKDPYTVIIGRSKSGFIHQCPNLWPHGLVAGSTGGGKSVMLKSIIAQFIHSTNFKNRENPNPSAQIILCDLKGGVEFSPFLGIPNVSVYSNTAEIVSILKKINKEMEERFNVLKKTGNEKIIPEKHQRDPIFLCIDESSLLYNQVRKSHPDYNNILEARFLTQKILKLGRSARISVIFGLQRPSKESIDTEVQENIDVRICFKVNTLEGSIRMLGNKNGLDLPAIPGRGIWKWGGEEGEIQTPFITKKDIEGLKTREKALFNSGEKKLKQPLIVIDSPKDDHPSGQIDWDKKS